MEMVKYALSAQPTIAELAPTPLQPREPVGNEILVKIEASSLNFHDYLVVTGGIATTPGRVPLSDGVGIVKACGPMSSDTVAGVSHRMSVPRGRTVDPVSVVPFWSTTRMVTVPPWAAAGAGARAAAPTVTAAARANAVVRKVFAIKTWNRSMMGFLLPSSPPPARTRDEPARRVIASNVPAAALQERTSLAECTRVGLPVAHALARAPHEPAAAAGRAHARRTMRRACGLKLEIAACTIGSRTAGDRDNALRERRGVRKDFETARTNS